MVAVVSRGDREFLAVHRTFLRADGSGKAPVAEPKMATAASLSIVPAAGPKSISTSRPSSNMAVPVAITLKP